MCALFWVIDSYTNKRYITQLFVIFALFVSYWVIRTNVILPNYMSWFALFLSYWQSYQQTSHLTRLWFCFQWANILSWSGFTKDHPRHSNDLLRLFRRPLTFGHGFCKRTWPFFIKFAWTTLKQMEVKLRILLLLYPWGLRGRIEARSKPEIWHNL